MKKIWSAIKTIGAWLVLLMTPIIIGGLATEATIKVAEKLIKSEN